MSQEYNDSKEHTAEILVIGGGARGFRLRVRSKRPALRLLCLSGTLPSAEPGLAVTTACTFTPFASCRASPPANASALPTLRFTRPVRALPAVLRPAHGPQCDSRLRSKARDPLDGAAHPLWQVETNKGTWKSQVVVIATGQYSVPRLPSWPGRETYMGQLIHSSDYRNGRAWSGKRALVVGVGNSGAEIATDLADAGASFVAISIRNAPFLTRRDTYGLPVQLLSFPMSMLHHVRPMCWREA